MRILLHLLLPIGDTLFATPAIHALREHFPDARITAIAYPTNSGILRDNPDIDEILLWPIRQNWPGIRGVLNLFRRLRNERFDLAVEFSNYGWWITKVCGIPRRTEMFLPKAWWLRPNAGRSWRKLHSVEHYCNVVRRLGVPVRDLRLRMTASEEEKAAAAEWLSNHEVRPGEVLIGIHPGGEGLWGRKRWSTEGFAAVADGLHEKFDARIVLMGGRDDAPLARQIAARSRAGIINATGQTTLGETAALASRCALFIGNDSSPLHIAAASGTRVVGIYGPTDPCSYRPWVPGGKDGEHYAVVRSHLSCACRFPLVGGITIVTWFACLLCPSLKTITPAQVLHAAARVLTAAGVQPKSPK